MALGTQRVLNLCQRLLLSLKPPQETALQESCQSSRAPFLFIFFLSVGINIVGRPLRPRSP